MAAIASSSQSDQEITIRIVFDGAPFAGKTTAAYALGQALGGTTSTPSEEDGRTVWFDWMTYTGGRHNGKEIRVELVTVPGQDDLRDRRHHLLGWGDVIVFVADTSATAFDETVTKYRELNDEQAATGTDNAIIVLANKRDLDDALPMDTVSERLGLSDADDIVEAVAADGSGLRQAFIYAVRAALARGDERTNSTTAALLLAEMQAAIAVEDRNAPLPEPVDETNATPETPNDETADTANATPETPNDEDTDTANATPETPNDETADTANATPAVAARTETISGRSKIRSGRVLVNASICTPDEDSGSPIMLLSTHWRIIIAATSGQTSFQLSTGTPEARAASDLFDRGLITGEVTWAAPAENPIVTQPSAEEPEPMLPPHVPTDIPAADPQLPERAQEAHQLAAVATRTAPLAPDSRQPDLSAAPANTEHLDVSTEDTADLRHARYRALRELRRSLRGY